MTTRTVALAILAGCVGGAACAADLSTRPLVTKAPVLAPGYVWSGCYVGGHFGGGWADQNWTSTANTTLWGDFAPGQGFSQSLHGLIGGGHTGCNLQTGAWVYGVEFTYAGADLSGDYTSVFGAPPDDFFASQLRSLFTATGRLGYAWNNWLAYAKAGYAGAKVRVSVLDNAGSNQGAGNGSAWHSGWTAGVGLEYGVTENVVLGLEYNYVLLSAKSFDLEPAANIYAWSVRTHDIHTVLGRASYKFGR